MTMPPLPKPYAINASHQFFLEDDMRSYAAAVRAAALEEAAKIADDMDFSPEGAIAAAIRVLNGNHP